MYDDGVEFDRVSFRVVTPGTDFLQGVSGSEIVRLSNGQKARVEWSENIQGFVATAFSAPIEPDRQCQIVTATAPIRDSGSSVDRARWVVTNPCDGKTLDIDITPDSRSDGFFACPSRLEFVQNGVQFDASSYNWFDRYTGANVCREVLPNLTKQTTVESKTVLLNFSRPFEIYYDQQIIFMLP